MRSLTPAFTLSVALVTAALAASCAKSAPSGPPITPPPVASDPAPLASAPLAPSFGPADLDRLLESEWTKAGVTPAPAVDDARFVRRVWIDLAGVIPPPEVVTAYVADGAPDKRERLVDGLLASPHYADAWTNTWDRLLLGKDVRRGVVDRDGFRVWLHDRLEKNTPWNQLAFDLISATGLNTGDAPAEDGAKPNPAVNYLLRFDNAADLTGTTSRVFLGVQIQCAQCHDHKTEKWKMTDFQKLAACFVRTKTEPLEKGKMGPGTRLFEVHDVDKTPMGKKAQMMAGDYLKVPPATLDGIDLSSSPNRRQALATWITSPDNPWFADAIVNRLWSHMMGRGFVEPVDDIRPSNPSTATDVWKALSSDLVKSGFDMKHTIRTLALSEAYSRATAAPVEKGDSGKLWTRFRMAPMGPGELVDSLVFATNLESRMQKTGRDNIEKIKVGLRRQFNVLFDVDEAEEDDDTFDGTIQQLLLLLNGRMTNDAVSAVPGTALDDIWNAEKTDEGRIKALYLRTLARAPSDTELSQWIAFVNAPREATVTAPPDAPPPPKTDGAKNRGKGKNKQPRRDPLEKATRDAKAVGRAPNPKKQAFEDVFWTLLNSSEFLFQH